MKMAKLTEGGLFGMAITVMEAVRTSETSVSFYKTTRPHIPEETGKFTSGRTGPREDGRVLLMRALGSKGQINQRIRDNRIIKTDEIPTVVSISQGKGTAR
jgi:hypothetical protein